MRFDTLKILLVDDNRHMRLLLTEMLRAIGVRQIFEAMDGVEALNLMRGVPIDIVITDLKMGQLGGIDFVNLLRRSPDSPNPFAPVLMVTGHSTLRRVQDARDAGVNEFLTKPVTGRSLVHRLTLLIEQPRPYIRCGTYFGPDRRRRTSADHKGPWRRDDDSIAIDFG
ncbi:response regulator [Caulobacter henricii]|uniref:Two-component system response regulator n=1 Tax=Caulobacter henricii TaxID=69395 RepID=A0A0P0P1T5_9CAUL|nr:response regulator [Caulobacter henricii]ALL14471.1 two-component system response regulator [Caulobacter henricii]